MSTVRMRGAGGRFVSVEVDDRVLQKMIAKTRGPIKPRIVADGVEYGFFVHNGTSKMGARPFMKMAVETVRPGFAKAFEGALTGKQIESVLDKTARDVAKGAKLNIRTLKAIDTGTLLNSIHVVQGDTPK